MWREQGCPHCPSRLVGFAAFLEIVQQRLTTSLWKMTNRVLFRVRVWGRWYLWSAHQKWGEFQVASWRKGRLLLGWLMEIHWAFWWQGCEPHYLCGFPVSCVLWVVRLGSPWWPTGRCESAMEHQVAEKRSRTTFEYFVGQLYGEFVYLLQTCPVFHWDARAPLVNFRGWRWRSKHLCMVSC